jgi:triosephosphate isomerase
MNGRATGGSALAERLARQAADSESNLSCDVVICPPATLLVPVAAAIANSPLLLGAQDCHAEPDGAHTGDISAGMLVDVGCRFVILGHSERRMGHGETNEVVHAKALAAHAAGLIAIICIGESESEHDRGETIAVVERQFSGSVPSGASADDTVVAYEPVWAIGSGRTPTLGEIGAVHGRLRELAASRLRSGDRVRLLYGGSVKPANAPAILEVANVDGALVGGASLKAEEFWAIATSAP